jgi:hypothetical protein
MRERKTWDIPEAFCEHGDETSGFTKGGNFLTDPVTRERTR